MSSPVVVPGSDDIDLYGNTVQLRIQNENAGEDFILSNISTDYVHAAMER